MERLTERSEGGKALPVDKICKDVVECINELSARCAAYEDTGLEPEEIVALANDKLESADFDVGTDMFKLAICKAFEANYGASLEHVCNLLTAEQDGRLVEQRFTPGSNIQVVEWGEREEVGEVSGYMFIAQVGEYVIATAYINDAETIEETMEYHKEDAAGSFHCDLSVFPIEDCYLTLEAAEAALREG